jgi:phenylacetate-CoA ligase
MFALPLREVVRLETTTGRNGEPLVVGYTRNDLEHWTEVTARLLAAAGVDRDDVVQICCDYGILGGGLGFIYGAERIGASVIPAFHLGPEGQLKIIQDYRASVLITTFPFLRRLARVMREQNLSAASTRLRIALLASEPGTGPSLQRLTEDLRLATAEHYTLPEMTGPPVAAECQVHQGLHLCEDQYLAEIVNPDTGEVLPPGGTGELVLTTIAKEAFPLIRYRTGDLTRMREEPCACGRTFRRIDRIHGRTDRVLLVNGRRVFPSQIQTILAELEGAEPHFRISLDRSGIEDVLEIQVEVSEDIFFDEVRKLQELALTAESTIHRKLDVPVRVKLVESRSLREPPPE